MKLSIIIPVYNVEEFLPQCLESCIQQDLSSSEYEVIVVNDGSPDNSFQIIADYSRKYSNIVVINKENGGLSSARNAGIKKAQGEYIWFVDSDDWIEENCLSTLVKAFESMPDVITLNTFLHIGKNRKAITRNLSPAVVYEGKEVYAKSYIYPYSGAQFFIFRKSFLQSYNLLFKEGIYYEDLLFTPEVLSVAKTCLAHKVPCYHYRIRENSITTSKISEKKIRDMLLVMDSQYAWTQSCKTSCTEMMADAICKTANSIIRNFIMKIHRNERKQWCIELKKRKFWLSCIKTAGGYKNYIYYIWLKLCLVSTGKV